MFSTTKCPDKQDNKKLFVRQKFFYDIQLGGEDEDIEINKFYLFPSKEYLLIQSDDKWRYLCFFRLYKYINGQLREVNFIQKTIYYDSRYVQILFMKNSSEFLLRQFNEFHYCRIEKYECLIVQTLVFQDEDRILNAALSQDDQTLYLCGQMFTIWRQKQNQRNIDFENIFRIQSPIFMDNISLSQSHIVLHDVEGNLFILKSTFQTKNNQICKKLTIQNGRVFNLKFVDSFILTDEFIIMEQIVRKNLEKITIQKQEQINQLQQWIVISQ